MYETIATAIRAPARERAAPAPSPEALDAYVGKCAERLIGVFERDGARVGPRYMATLRRVAPAFGADHVQAWYAAYRLFAAVSGAAFARYPWLLNYMKQEEGRRGLPPAGAGAAAAEQFAARLGEVQRVVRLCLPGAGNSLPREICVHILSNPESNLQLKSIAGRFFVNRTYLCALFRQKTGVHYQEYVSTVKMMRARYLVEHSDALVMDICRRLQYRDTNYFSRRFREFHGDTPQAFRKGFARPT